MPRVEVSKWEKVFLITELVFIFLYFVCTITELFFIFSMYSQHGQSSQYYFYHLIHQRIRPKSYNSFIKPMNPSADCPTYPKPEDDNVVGPLPYTPRKILELGKFSSANVTDVTDKTQVYDGDRKIVANNTRNAWNFYHMDMQVSNKSEVLLQTNYQFQIWKGVKLCVMKMRLDDPAALAVIPKEQSCSVFLENKYAMDCGVYMDTYKLCTQYNYISMDDSFSLTEIDRSGFEDDWSCPFNYFNINFSPNPAADPSNVDEIPIDGTTYQQFMNEVEDVNYAQYKDKYLFYDLDNAILGDYQKINTPMDEFIFAQADPTEYRVGNKYGFTDSFNGIIDTYDFMQMYNDTYYKEPVVNATGHTTYEPGYFFGSDEGKFYLPVDSSQEKIQASLTFWAHDVFSPECFTEFIAKNKYWTYWKVIKNIGTEFLDESIPLLIAWIFVQLFISLFWHVKIRYVLIRQKLAKGYLNSPDERSEFETKFTSRLVGVIMFALNIHGALFQRSSFQNIIDVTTAQIDYSCYPAQLTIDSIKEYRTYVENLNNQNTFLLFLLLTCLVMEVIISVYFLVEFYFHRKRVKEEREAMKKD